jgi:aldose 1-epimerase
MASSSASRNAIFGAPPDTLAIIEIRNGSLSLGIAPEIGASIAWFRHAGLAVLRETPGDAIRRLDGRAFSAFPLIPFSNRIRGGNFSFDGKNYSLARDAEDPRHALHGTARFKPWRVQWQNADHARFALEYMPQAGDWPFAYEAWQDFLLLPDRFRLLIGMRNTGTTAAPAGIGLHPYFVRRDPVFLHFAAAYVWGKDAEDIPTHSEPDAGRFAFLQRRPIGDGLIDNDYGAWGGTVDIQGDGQHLRLLAGDAFSHLVLFTPAEKPYFAAESVTHRPDAINPNYDPEDHGMAVLQPGESLAGTIEIILA